MSLVGEQHRNGCPQHFFSFNIHFDEWKLVLYLHFFLLGQNKPNNEGISQSKIKRTEKPVPSVISRIVRNFFFQLIRVIDIDYKIVYAEKSLVNISRESSAKKEEIFS